MLPLRRPPDGLPCGTVLSGRTQDLRRNSPPAETSFAPEVRQSLDHTDTLVDGSLLHG